MKTLSRIYVVLILLFLFAPIIVMMLFSFNGSSSTAVLRDFPSFKWYEDLFQNEQAGEALRNTLILAVLSSLIATILGTLAAVGLSRLKRRWVRDTIQSVTKIPMMNPDIVTAVSMLMFFVFVGSALGIASRSFLTVLIAHVTFNLPYVILSITPKIRQMDKHLLEAAADLGCTPIQTFFRVELPVILPGILSGLLMAFTLSIDDFVITLFTKGMGFNTLPTYIYSQTKQRVTPDMYALSTLIFLVILVLLILSNVLQAQMDARRDPKKIAARAAKKKKRI